MSDLRRLMGESLAGVMARICDISVSQLRSMLNDKRNSRYQTARTP